MRLKVILICMGLLILSCKEKARTGIEIKESGDYILEIKRKNDTLISSRTYDRKTSKLLYDFYYNKKGITDYVVEYYENGQIKNTSKLVKEPYVNVYLDVGYFINGVMEHEGCVNYINGKKYREGWWIFYDENGSVEGMVEFANDGKGNEWVLQKRDVKKVQKKER